VFCQRKQTKPTFCIDGINRSRVKGQHATSSKNKDQNIRNPRPHRGDVCLLRGDVEQRRGGNFYAVPTIAMVSGEVIADFLRVPIFEQENY
jgi:hypothetical protein